MTYGLLNNLNSKIIDSTLIKFTNCYVKVTDDIVYDDLYVRNGIIQDYEKIFFDEKVSPDVIINCNGSIISPGFIDIQINGGYGYDFSDSSQDFENSLNCVGEKLVQHGVTAYCPTIVISPKETYKLLLKKLYKSSFGQAHVLGYHVEGPFLSVEKSGMHKNSLVMTDFGSDSIATLLDVYGDDLSNIKYVTLAPEIPGSCEVIKYLKSKHISVSLGHSVASFDEGVKAIESGANMLTHVFCSMLPFHHRDPHLVGLLAYNSPSHQSLYYGIITDLVHTHASAIRIAHRVNRNGLIAVSDANPAFGLKDGLYNFGSSTIQVIDGSSFVEGTGVLAGSTTALDQCMRNYWSAANTSRSEALDAVTCHPAEALKVERKGKLEAGFDADLVILDYESMHVQSTWIGGQVVHHDQQSNLDITFL